METFLIRCYLWAPGVPWSDELTEQLLEDLAGFLAERGFSNPDDGDIRSVLVAGATEVPEVEEWVRELTDDAAASFILIPGPGS